MDPEAERAITPEFSSGETLVWAGRPRLGIVFRGRDWFLTIFGFVWTCFTIGIFLAPDSHDSPLLLPPVTLLFVAIGLYMLFGRLVLDAIARRQVFYGLTNQRVIIVSNFFIHQTKSMLLRSLSDVSLREFGGLSSISFGAGPSWFNDPYGFLPAAINPAATAFELIDNAKLVFELIRETQAKTA